MEDPTILFLSSLRKAVNDVVRNYPEGYIEGWVDGRLKRYSRGEVLGRLWKALKDENEEWMTRVDGWREVVEKLLQQWGEVVKAEEKFNIIDVANYWIEKGAMRDFHWVHILDSSEDAEGVLINGELRRRMEVGMKYHFALDKEGDPLMLAILTFALDALRFPFKFVFSEEVWEAQNEGSNYGKAIAVYPPSIEGLPNSWIIPPHAEKVFEDLYTFAQDHGFQPVSIKGGFEIVKGFSTRLSHYKGDYVLVWWNPNGLLHEWYSDEQLKEMPPEFHRRVLESIKRGDVLIFDSVAP